MKAAWMRNRVNIAKKTSRREDGANATNIAYGSETVGARFAQFKKLEKPKDEEGYMIIR